MTLPLSGWTVAVTGGSGFVGRHVIRRLLDDGASVRAFLRNPDLWGPSSDRLELRRLDLGTPEAWGDALVGVDTVCHAAAYKPPNHRDSAFAAECFRTNALGTLALLECSARAGVRRFMFLSTNIYAPQDRPAVETDPVRPSAHSPHYLLSKACGDYYVDVFGASGPLQTVILRLASVYGPGMGNLGLVPTFATRLSRGEGIKVADGGRWRVDLVHVADVVRAATAALAADVRGVFNVASGSSVTTLAVAEMMVELLGLSRNLIEIEPPGVALPTGLPPLDVTRARRLLDYSPMTTRDGLADYLASQP